MSEKISLVKRQEKLVISLKKKKIAQITLRVASALDISGSMQSLYRNGTVSDFVGKLLPFGMQFDDNQQIDMWAFNNYSSELPPATAAVYDDYVGKCMRNVSINGGTSYAPVIQAIYDEYFGGVPMKTVTREIEVQEQRPVSGFFAKLTGKTETVTVKKTVTEQVPDTSVSVDTTPAMVFFQTDGENNDESAVRTVLDRNKGKPIYWFMVGVGNARFSFLKALADEYDNVAFIGIDDLDLSDEALYDKLLSEEFGQWVEKVGAKN